MNGTEEIITALLKGVGTGGVISLILIVGLKWLDRDRNGLLRVIDTERDARIKVLEQHAKACMDDRMLLHQSQSRLQDEVRDLMRRMIAQAGKCGGECMTDKKGPKQ